MYWNFFLFFFLISFYSCRNYEYEYYPNGSVLSKIEYKDSLPHGKAMFFYPSGQLEAEYIMNMGKKNGIVRDYYDTGELKELKNFKNDQPSGLAFWYRKNGKLRVKREYLRVRGASHLNRVWVYKGNGELDLERSNTFEFMPSRDTILSTETYRISGKVFGSAWNGEMDVVITEMDEEFHLLDRTKGTVLPIKDFVFLHEIKSLSEGRNFIRGVIREQKEVIEKVDGQDEVFIKERILYFSKEIFVLDLPFDPKDYLSTPARSSEN